MRISLKLYVLHDRVFATLIVYKVRFLGLQQMEKLYRNTDTTLFNKPITNVWRCKCKHKTWRQHYMATIYPEILEEPLSEQEQY